MPSANVKGRPSRKIADTEAQRDYPREVLVSVSSEGAYTVNKTPVTGRSVDILAVALSEGAKAGKDSVVIIHADASARHQDVITVMEAARRAGLSQITFATQSTARAKGNRETVVVMKHVLRNAALPLITVVGLQFGVLLTGAIITERVFDWPGLGSLILEGINNRDYPVVQGCVLVFSFTYLVVNLLTDLSYAVVDPRIKADR